MTTKQILQGLASSNAATRKQAIEALGCAKSHPVLMLPSGEVLASCQGKQGVQKPLCIIDDL